jgi:hypothetical protein
MLPDISEFSFGFALTNELLGGSYGLKTIGAPIFPSLRDEGQLGYDVKLQIVGPPIFLQFKLSHCMVSGTATGSAKLSLPHYRMHLRPLRHSQQHNLLLNLEKRGNRVYYVAPEFHLPHELNDAYQAKQVVVRSAIFRPLAIGPLSDDDDHFVSFSTGSLIAYRFSEPTQIERESSIGLVEKWINDQPAASPQRRPTRIYFQQLGDELLSTWEETLRQAEGVEVRPIRYQLQDLEPADRLAMLAHTIFACTVIFATRSISERTDIRSD